MELKFFAINFDIRHLFCYFLFKKSNFTYVKIFIFIIGQRGKSISLWESYTIGVHYGGVKSRIDGLIPIEFRRFTKIVWHSFEEVPSHQLFVKEIVKVSTYFFGHVVLIAGHPIREHFTHVVIICIQFNIFHEVIKLVFRIIVFPHIFTGIIRVHYICFDIVHSSHNARAWKMLFYKLIFNYKWISNN